MTSKKKCSALQFPAKTTDAVVLTKCSAEWVKRNKRADGTLNPNNYAPIYLKRGGESLSVRRVGKELVLSAVVSRCALPYKTAPTWG